MFDRVGHEAEPAQVVNEVVTDVREGMRCSVRRERPEFVGTSSNVRPGHRVSPKYSRYWRR